MYLNTVARCILPFLFIRSGLSALVFPPEGDILSPEVIDINGNTFHHDLDRRYKTLKVELDGEMQKLDEVVLDEGLQPVVRIINNYGDKTWVKKNIIRVVNGYFQRDSQTLSHWVHKPAPKIVNEGYKKEAKYQLNYSYKTVLKQVEVVEGLLFRIKTIIGQQQRQGDAGWEIGQAEHDAAKTKISNIRKMLTVAETAPEILKTWFRDMPMERRKGDPKRKLPFDAADYFRHKLLHSTPRKDQYWIEWYATKRKWIDSQGTWPNRLEGYHPYGQVGRSLYTEKNWDDYPNEAAVIAAERAADDKYVKYQIEFALIMMWQKIIRRGLFVEELPVQAVWQGMQGNAIYINYWIGVYALETTASTTISHNEHVSKAKMLLGVTKSQMYNPAGTAYDFLMRKALNLEVGQRPKSVNKPVSRPEISSTKPKSA